MRLTALAHTLAAERLAPGDLAVDATAGNGHDTKFLAKRCGPTGAVWAFDIQAEAIAATRRRLEKHGLAEKVILSHTNNARLAEVLPDDAKGRISLCMANLGYLPGGDPRVITETENTTRMLEAALAVLRPGGTLLVIAYPGHEGGDHEAAAVYASLKSFESRGHRLTFHGTPLDAARRPWLADLVKHP